MLRVKTHIVTPFEQNARILLEEEQKCGVIIDPGGDVDLLFILAKPKKYNIESILLTHCHIDHGGGVKQLLKCFELHQLPIPKLYYHSEDEVIGQNIESYAAAVGLSPQLYQNVPKADQWLDNQSVFKIGDLTSQVLFVPGHSPGHIALYFETIKTSLSGQFSEPTQERPILIGGDTLFRESIGRADLPMADYPTLMTSIKLKLLKLPDDTLVLPGHGENTSIGYEKKFNPFLQN